MMVINRENIPKAVATSWKFLSIFSYNSKQRSLLTILV